MRLKTSDVKTAVLGILEKQGVSPEQAESRMLSLRKQGGGIPIVGDLVGGATKLLTTYGIPAAAIATIGGGMAAGGAGYYGYKKLQESQDKVRAKELEKQQYLQAIKSVQDAINHPVSA